MALLTDQKPLKLNGVFRRLLRLESLAYILLILTFGIGIVTFVTLSSVENLSNQTNNLLLLLTSAAGALILLIFIVGRQLFL